MLKASGAIPGARKGYRIMATALQPLTFSALQQLYGRAYMAHFLRAAAGDHDRAALFQEWNGHVAAAFHHPLESVEVLLRRVVDDAFSAEFGLHWWSSSAFQAAAQPETVAAIGRAIHRAGSRASHHQVVAALSFGNLAALVRPRFFDSVWRLHLAASFPHHRGHGFHLIGSKAYGLVKLRNAIGHHDPVIGFDLGSLHADVLVLLRWMSPLLAQHVALRSSVPRLLTTRP